MIVLVPEYPVAVVPVEVSAVRVTVKDVPATSLPGTDTENVSNMVSAWVPVEYAPLEIEVEIVGSPAFVSP